MFRSWVNNVRNVNDAFREGLSLINGDYSGVEIITEESRNGKVFVHNGPVITDTAKPMERVLFNPARDANPFFHLFESLWMLGGRNDLAWLAQFNKQMATYSDDGGKTQPAAYGFRWREHFGYDQLPVIINELRRDPTTRRCVLQMWDGSNPLLGDAPIEYGESDLMRAVMGSKDVPCNTCCYFTIRDGELHMAVTCRSNDLLWGAHGANAVHFSILLEYVAAHVGVKVGTMTQFSWNYHLYDGVLKHPIPEVRRFHQDPYANGAVAVTPMFDPSNMAEFDAELPRFLDRAAPDNLEMGYAGFTHPFLKNVAIPMLRTWRTWKNKSVREAIQQTYAIGWSTQEEGDREDACDWQVACRNWLQRRYDKLHNARNGYTETSV